MANFLLIYFYTLDIFRYKKKELACFLWPFSRPLTKRNKSRLDSLVMENHITSTHIREWFKLDVFRYKSVVVIPKGFILTPKPKELTVNSEVS